MSKVKKHITLVLPALLVVVLALALVKPAFAPHFGCTHGFWKNHTNLWPGGIMELSLADVFNYHVDGVFYVQTDPWGVNSEFVGMAEDGLLAALCYRGGSGLEGAARILLRSAAASYLNYLVLGDEWRGKYDYDEATGRGDILGLQTHVYSVLGSMDRDAMLDLAQRLDYLNNWYCPLVGNKNKNPNQ